MVSTSSTNVQDGSTNVQDGSTEAMTWRSPVTGWPRGSSNERLASLPQDPLGDRQLVGCH